MHARGGDIVADIAHALGGAKRTANGYDARCPCHDDNTASLSLSIGKTDKLVWRCHVGCSQEAVGAVLKARGLLIETERQVALNGTRPHKRTSNLGRVVATYDYRDESDTLLCQALRFEPKNFRQRKPDGNGGWVNNVNGVRRVIYRLPDVTEALSQGRPVFVAEGEKDVDRLWSLGVPATCNIAGAGKWRPEDSAFLAGGDIIVLPDNDKPGRDHADQVATALQDIAARVRVLNLPDLPPKGDVSDWLDAGNKAERLWELVASVRDWSTAKIEFDDEIAIVTNADALVKGVIHPGDIVSLYGASGVGKTFAAIDLAYHIALEVEWHGHRVRKAPVLYVGLEGIRGLRHRMVACREHFGSAGHMLARITAHTALDKSDSGKAGEVEIVAAAKALERAASQPVGLIIVDTLARAIAGDDENSAQDIAAFVGRASAVARETGAAVLVIHHPGKDDARGMRGSNALFAACDAVMKIAEQDESRLVTAEKVKDGVLGDLFAYRLRQVILGVDDDGDQVTSCLVEKIETPLGAAKRQRGRPGKHDQCMRALEEALDEVGTVPHGSKRLPQGPTARVVTFDQWLVYVIKIGVVDPTLASKFQRQFLRRNLTRLASEKKVDSWNEYVWKINA